MTCLSDFNGVLTSVVKAWQRGRPWTCCMPPLWGLTCCWCDLLKATWCVCVHVCVPNLGCMNEPSKHMSENVCRLILSGVSGLCSGFTLPSLSPPCEWRSVHCKRTGGLKEGRRRGGERGGGRMHGRAIAVAVWTKLYCPGNLSQWLPRGPCSYPSPTPYTLSPSQTQTHTFSCNTAFSHTLSLFYPTRWPSTFPSFLTSRPVLLLLLLPAPPPLQLLIISPHWCDGHASQTAKAKTCNLLICIPSLLNEVAHCF